MRVSKEGVLTLFGMLSTLSILALMMLMTGCATTQSTIDNSRKEIITRNLLHQQTQQKDQFNMSLVTVSDLMAKELKEQKSDPIAPVGRSFISEFTNEAMALMPSLSLRKYSTTTLSSKTGQQATYTTTFPILNLMLSSFVKKRFYLRMKYLDKVILSEAIRVGYRRDYIDNIVKSMTVGYGHWSGLVKQPHILSNPYLASLIEVTYRAIAIYQLSSKSAKISTIAYYLQNNEFDKVDNILAKEQIKTLKKLADRINSKREKSLRKYARIYSNIDINDLKKHSNHYTKIYFKFLPKSIIQTRKRDIKLTINKLIAKMKRENLYTALAVIQKYQNNPEIMSRLTVALFNSGSKHPYMIDFSTYSSTCLEAGINFMNNYGISLVNGKRKSLADNAAYNIGVLQKLKCKEADDFKELLSKIIP